MKRTWIVEVGHEDGDPTVYGPYTDLQATRVVERIQAEIDLATTRTGRTLHPADAINVISIPLRRYVFLSAAERAEIRRQVRAENRAAVYTEED